MSVNVADLIVTMRSDVSDLKTSFSNIEQQAKQTGSAFSGTLKALTAFAAGFVTLSAGIKILKDSVVEAMESEKQITLLKQAVESAGISWATYGGQIDEVVQASAKYAKVQDEVVQAALRRLVLVTDDVAGSTKNLNLVFDLARARGMDFEQAALVIGKAMEGDIATLGRFLPDVKQLNDLMGSNALKSDMAAKAMQILTSRFSGAGGAFGELEGSARDFSVALREMEESFGKLISSPLAGALNGIVRELDRIRLSALLLKGTWLELILRLAEMRLKLNEWSMALSNDPAKAAMWVQLKLDVESIRKAIDEAAGQTFKLTSAMEGVAIPIKTAIPPAKQLQDTLQVTAEKFAAMGGKISDVFQQMAKMTGGFKAAEQAQIGLLVSQGNSVQQITQLIAAQRKLNDATILMGYYQDQAKANIENIQAAAKMGGIAIELYTDAIKRGLNPIQAFIDMQNKIAEAAAEGKSRIDTVTASLNNLSGMQKLWSDLRKEFVGFLDSVTTGFSQATAQWIMGVNNFRQFFMSTLESLIGMVINYVVRVLAEQAAEAAGWTSLEVLKTALTSEGAAARTAIAATEAATTTSIFATMGTGIMAVYTLVATGAKMLLLGLAHATVAVIGTVVAGISAVLQAMSYVLSFAMTALAEFLYGVAAAVAAVPYIGWILAAIITSAAVIIQGLAIALPALVMGIAALLTTGVAALAASIPAMASGGIVTGPTLALIGEAGPEAVIPLSGGFGGGLTIRPAPIYLNGRHLADVLFEEEMPRKMRRQGLGR